MRQRAQVLDDGLALVLRQSKVRVASLRRQGQASASHGPVGRQARGNRFQRCARRVETIASALRPWSGTRAHADFGEQGPAMRDGIRIGMNAVPRSSAESPRLPVRSIRNSAIDCASRSSSACEGMRPLGRSATGSCRNLASCFAVVLARSGPSGT